MQTSPERKGVGFLQDNKGEGEGVVFNTVLIAKALILAYLYDFATSYCKLQQWIESLVRHCPPALEQHSQC